MALLAVLPALKVLVDLVVALLTRWFMFNENFDLRVELPPGIEPDTFRSEVDQALLPHHQQRWRTLETDQARICVVRSGESSEGAALEWFLSRRGEVDERVMIRGTDLRRAEPRLDAWGGFKELAALRRIELWVDSTWEHLSEGLRIRLASLRRHQVLEWQGQWLVSGS